MMFLNGPKKTFVAVVSCGILFTGAGLFGQEVNKSEPQSVVEGTLPASNLNPPSAFASPPQTRQNRAAVKSDWLFRMKDGSLVVGNLAEPITLSVMSRHGEFSVKSDDLVSLRTIASQSNAAESQGKSRIVVATKSGDIVSGSCEMQPIKIKLTWGEASIDPDALDFISFRDGSVSAKTISRATHGGKGWILAPVQIVHREQRVGNATYAVHVQSPGQLLTAPGSK